LRAALDLQAVPEKPVVAAQPLMAARSPISIPPDDEPGHGPGAAVAAAASAPAPRGQSPIEPRGMQKHTKRAPKRSAVSAMAKQIIVSELRRAAKRGDTAAVQHILDGGTNVDTPVLGTWRCVDLAALGGHHALVQVLLERGASVKHERNLPLYLACARCDCRIVQLLLDAGCQPADCASSNGRTALHWAAASEDSTGELGQYAPSAVLQQLLPLLPPECATVSCTAGTPLHVALRLGRYGNAQALLDAFPQHAMVTGNGVATLDVALSTRDPRALSLVLHAPLPMGGLGALQYLPDACSTRNNKALSAMQWMLLCRAVRDSGRECTAANVRLLRAASAGDAARMDRCVQEGADPDVLMLHAPTVTSMLTRSAPRDAAVDAGFSLQEWMEQRGLLGCMEVPVSPVWQELGDDEVDSDSS